MKKKNKVSLIVVGALLALLVMGIFVYAHYNNQYPEFEDKDGNPSAIYPLNDGMLTIAPNIRMLFDTGSLISTITPEDLKKLKKLGMSVDSAAFPSLATNLKGEVYMADRRYTVSLPVWQTNWVPDSVGSHYESTGRIINTIKDVIFLPASPGDPSRIGSDVVERFVMEYQRTEQAIALYNEVPKGYEFFCDLNAPFSWVTFIGTGSRYYITMEVQGYKNEYFINTAIDDIHLKLPVEDTVYVTSPLDKRAISAGVDTISALVADDVWVKIGDRAGSHSAVYGDDGRESYAINPLNYFAKDIVIDFQKRRLYQKY